MIDRPTICGFCSCGCAFYAEPQAGVITALCASETHPVSSGRLCIKGWNAVRSLIGSDRLRTPLIRREERLEPASWDEAISFTASALKRICSDAGPQAVGVIGSAKTTNEECYSIAKLARAIINTPNLDGPCSLYDASAISGLLDTIGLPGSQLDLNSIRNAGSMLVVGANVTEQLAHVGSRIEDAVQQGCKVIAVDPRKSRLAAYSSLFVQPKPGSDLIWIRALLKTLIDRKLFIESAPRMPGYAELERSVASVDLAGLRGACGVTAEQIAEMAGLLAENPPTVVMFGLGVLQQRASTQLVKALAYVALLLGGTLVPLRGQNNAQGASDMGLMRDFLPGYAPMCDVEARKKWESVWKCKLPGAPGLSAVDMIRACGAKDVRALLVFGENIALSCPKTEDSLLALDSAQFLAVSDLYLNETALIADVVFPACSFLEKDGTFTNIERRVQRVRKVVDPVGESKSDLEIAAELARALGGQLESDPPRVMAEISANVSQYAGVSYDALDSGWGAVWPTNGAQAKLAAVPAPEADDDPEYPFRLIAARVCFHQQTGTMASRSPVLAREYPESFVEMNEGDAEKLGIRPGTLVRVSSRSGSLERRMVLSDGVSAGCVHVPLFFGGDSPNSLASYDCDPASGVPVYKACPVRVEALR